MIRYLCITAIAFASLAGIAWCDELAFFESKVRPLLVKRCYQCHSSEAKIVQGGLKVDARSALVEGGDSGPAVTPGKPDESLLMAAVRHEGGASPMPPDGQLPQSEQMTLARWIRQGAKMPDDHQKAAQKSVIDFEKGRDFWSFQPPQRSPLPAIEQPHAARRVDAFVNDQLRRQSLVPSPAADRGAIIRRITFDLVGLPPSPDEVSDFVQDDSPDAYERLVDRLLASPAYGERWGRHWLDLARYTDTTAGWLKSTGAAHLYRDWVVQATNEDVDYRQFVKRQLAADMQDAGRVEDLPALGFLGLSPTYWKELRLAPDLIKTVVAEEWEERIDAVGRVFLGLTIACARCHDHKFDPISTKDYYALAGVFASVRLADRPLVDAESAKAVLVAHEQVAKLQEQIKKLRQQKAPANEIESLQGRVAEIEKSTPHYGAPQANVVEEASLYVVPDGPDKTRLEYKVGQARNVAVQIRGNPANQGEVMPRRFLTVLSSSSGPPTFQQGSGRLELAEAILNEGAPLASRVAVNRVWKHHFGRGLVDTPSNFGVQGARPSHPRLLDDLAARFMAHGWSFKWLHREIVGSAAYRRSSAFHQANDAHDPANRYLWRMNRRRLDVESWRDAALAAAGQLDRKLGGPPLDLNASTNRRRTIYGAVHRRDLNVMLRLYDFPDPTRHSPMREPTTTPLQQLFMLNSPFVADQSAALVGRLNREGASGVDERADRLFELLLSRSPTNEERRWAQSFLEDADEQAWRDYAQALLISNEFLFVD